MTERMLVLASCLACGCVSTERCTDSLAGTWSSVGNSSLIQFTFNADGTFSEMLNQHDHGSGIWKVDGNQIQIASDQCPGTSTFEIRFTAECDRMELLPKSDSCGLVGVTTIFWPGQGNRDLSMPIPVDLAEPLDMQSTAGPACDNSNSVYCNCMQSLVANSVPCDPLSQGNAVCCADSNWPSLGATCQCISLSCAPQETTAGPICSCVASKTGTPSSFVCTNQGGVCCDANESCTCNSNVTSCPAGAGQVSACNANTVGCPSGQHSVPSCR